MTTTLRILMLEDNPSDAELEIAALEGAGFHCDWNRVESRKELIDHLNKGDHDLILSDFALPSFNGIEALRLVREQRGDIPFILVSGTVGEDAAIESLRSGATDYVLKNRLSRLVPVVKRALKEYEEQQARRQAQRELAISQRRLRTLFNTIPDLVYMKDLEGNYLGCNNAFERFCGMPASELAGKNDFDIMDRKQAEFFMEADRRALEEGTLWQSEGMLKFSSDGNTGSFEVIESPLFDPTGEMFGIMGVARDITQRKLAMEALRDAKQELQYILDNVDDVVFSMNMEGYYTYASAAMERATGYTPEEICNMNIMDLVAPEHHGYFEEKIQEAMNGQRYGGTYVFEVVCKDGSRRWHEALTRVQSDEQTKKPIAVQGVVRDITERRQAEEELFRMSAAVNQIVEAVVITDANGDILYVNPSFEKLSGFRSEDVLGHNPSMWKSGYHGKEFYQTMWDSLLQDGWWTGRFCNKRKDGSVYTEEATISAVKDASGNVVNYVAVKRDITKEIELEEMVRQSQKMDAISRLAGGLAHDLNNILQTIFGFCSIMLMETQTIEDLRADVHEIQQAAQRASDMTRQLLTFSRREAAVLEPVDLNDLLKEETRMLERLLGAEIRFEFDPADDLWLIDANPNQIQQVVMNLVVNARDAMPDGGVITVRTRNIDCSNGKTGPFPSLQAERLVRISVADTGGGMDEEVRSHLFEPFFTTKPVGKGTGLGLAVIYGIIEQHNGWIDVESKKGEGSEFNIFLPACKST